MDRYNVSYQDIFETIQRLKDQGVSFEDVLDDLEFDSDQYPNPKDLKEARAKIYMKKQVKDLKPGDAFRDSLGIILKVEKIEFLPWNQVPRTAPQVRVYFDTGLNRIFMNFRSDRIVDVV